MATPNITLRVPPEYRDLVRAVVARLKREQSFATVLQAALETRSAGTGDVPPDLAERLNGIDARLDDQARAFAESADLLATLVASFKYSATQRLSGIEDRLNRLEDQLDTEG